MAKLSLKISILLLIVLNLFLLDRWILRRDSGKLTMILLRAQSMAVDQRRPFMILFKDDRALLKETPQSDPLETQRLFTLSKMDNRPFGEEDWIVFDLEGKAESEHQTNGGQGGREIQLKSFFGQKWFIVVDPNGAVKPGAMINR